LGRRITGTGSSAPHLKPRNDFIANIPRTTKPHNRKERHDEENPNFKASPAATLTLIVCALVATVGVGSGIAADKNAKVTLVEYGPGGTSPAHTHPKSAFIYATVLEGAIRTSVNNGPVVTYRAGQSFSEMPGDRHSVSENASKTEPAKLLAVFVVDTDEKDLTIPYKK
jgi:quercetin dioxygenase-like cupin family protein